MRNADEGVPHAVQPPAGCAANYRTVGVYMWVVLKGLVKKGPLGLHFLKGGILTKLRNLPSGLFGDSILNDYHIEVCPARIQ